MKKSNKISLFYILSSISLLLVLVFGGIYGIYVSVGLNFASQNMANVAGVPNGGATNVSIGGTVNFEYSMVGVIILSLALIVVAIFDIVSLIRQIILFKQFKVIQESSFEKAIEKKVKSKGKIVFFAIIIDLISLALGIVGVFINSRSFASNNYAWLFYLIDAFIIIFALASMILLIIKLRNHKKFMENKRQVSLENRQKKSNEEKQKNYKLEGYDLDEVEYKLLKLKHMKNTKVISQDEYKSLREKLLKENNLKTDNSNNEK